MPKPLIILLIALGIIVYTLLSIWFFYGKANVSKISTPSLLNNTSASAVPQQLIPSNTSQVRLVPTITSASGPTATPAPTPTPLQGPGRYACDPFGTCKDYSDEVRKNCTVTFADRNCLGQCGNPAKRCTQ